MTLHVVYCPLCPAGMVRPLYACASRDTALRVQMAHAERHPGHRTNPKHVGRRQTKEVTPDPIASLFAV